MKKKTAAGIAALAAGITGLGAMSTALAHYAVHGVRYDPEETLENDTSEYPYLKEYVLLGPNFRGSKQYMVKSHDGLPLQVQYYQGDKDSRKFVILVHGYTMNRFSMLKYVPIYMDMGYHCIVYDHRGHGDSDRKEVCTFGIREAKDLLCVIEDTYQRFGDDIYLGLHGESLGSGTQITALQYKPKVRFLVNDCGFEEILNVMKGGLREMHLPDVLVYPASMASKAVYGERFDKMRPIDSLADNEVPICFIHGEADTFIRPFNSEDMWKKTKGYAELHLFPGAAHAKSLYTDPVKYRKVVTAFVRKIEERDGVTEPEPEETNA